MNSASGGSKPHCWLSKITGRRAPPRRPLGLDDVNVNPPGRPIITRSAASSTFRSSAIGWMTMPCTEASARKSTKSWAFGIPRVGPERSDDEQRIADVWILNAVDLARVVERNVGARTQFVDDRAAHHANDRLCRIDDGIADIDGPIILFRSEADEARTLKLDAHPVAHRPDGLTPTFRGSRRFWSAED